MVSLLSKSTHRSPLTFLQAPMKRLRVLGDALPRSHKLPVLPFLAPALIPSSHFPYTIQRPARSQHTLFARRFLSSSSGCRASAAQAAKEAPSDSQPSTEAPPSPEPLQPVKSEQEQPPSIPSPENVAEGQDVAEPQHVTDAEAAAEADGVAGADDVSQTTSNNLHPTPSLPPSTSSSSSDSTPVGEESSLLDSLIGSESQDPLAEKLKRMRPSGDNIWAKYEKPMEEKEYTSEKTINSNEFAKQRALLNRLQDSAVQRSFDRSNAQEQDRNSQLSRPLPSELLPRAGQAYPSPQQTLTTTGASARPLRLDPYMGRSVPVASKIPLAQAIRRLDFKLRVNHVKSDLMYQRFHERAGLKRKRLKRERWRRRFREGFKAMVEQVQRMRKQGW